MTCNIDRSTQHMSHLKRPLIFLKSNFSRADLATFLKSLEDYSLALVEVYVADEETQRKTHRLVSMEPNDVEYPSHG
jgi:hypothetical protein